MATSKAAELKRLFATADSALFDLHRYIEQEYGHEVWRSIFGMRLSISRLSDFPKFMAAPPAAERPSHD